MPYLQEIIGHINSKLIEQDSILDRSNIIKKFYGIAKTLPNTGEQSRMPIVYDTESASQFAGIDDRYNLNGYHKITSRKIEASQNNFGDGNSMMIETTQVNLICWTDLERLNMDENEIADKVFFSIPTKIADSFRTTLNGVGVVDVVATDINTDSLALWNAEYTSFDYVLSESQTLFAVTYEIVTHYNKNCITNCDEC